MLIKYDELIGDALNWAVDVAQGVHWSLNGYFVRPETPYIFSTMSPDYSTDWGKGGPIVEKEWSALTRLRINLADNAKSWDDDGVLVGFMRLFVLSRLGNAVEIPEKLL